jgi:hypothetical protein
MQRRGRVRVEVVLHQHDFFGLRIYLFALPLDGLCPVLRGASSGNPHATPFLQRFIHNEHTAHAAPSGGGLQAAATKCALPRRRAWCAVLCDGAAGHAQPPLGRARTAHSGCAPRSQWIHQALWRCPRRATRHPICWYQPPLGFAPAVACSLSPLMMFCRCSRSSTLMWMRYFLAIVLFYHHSPAFHLSTWLF